MNKKVLYSESAYSNINIVENKTETHLRVATFCVVTKVDKDNKTINAQPLIKEKVRKNDNTYDYVSLPELANVPYCTNMKDDPKVDDFCICIHLDRGIRGYDKDSLMKFEGTNSGVNKHKLSDCVAITGFDIG